MTNSFNYNDFEKPFVEHDDRLAFLNENEKKIFPLTWKWKNNNIAHATAAQISKRN